MKLKVFFIAILMITLFLGMIGHLVTDMNQNYPSANQSKQTTQLYQEMSNTTSGINGLVNDMKGAVNKMSSGEGIASKIIGGAYMLALIPILAIDVIFTGTKVTFLIPQVALTLGVPQYIVYLFVLIFWVSLIFGVVTLLWRFKE